jgi:hypothetical protein
VTPPRYLKQEIVAPRSDDGQQSCFTSVIWHPEEALTLILTTSSKPHSSYIVPFLILAQNTSYDVCMPPRSGVRQPRSLMTRARLSS